ncbi:MAG TPA: branched-chain amino acid ABC transporter substrate-binding protein [Candidatus Baltobacteraceae bacterium]|nr:branched-chain amino acid ABC transporter substrate-binding protein [Candidatus Baltobacteraceae bacterium]
MTLNRRTFIKAAAGAAGAAALPLTARAQFTRGMQQPLTIAVNVPLSHNGANAGIDIQNGVAAAIDEVNRTGGTFGTAFQIRPIDDMDALAQSMVNVQYAASDSTCVAVIGGFDGNLISASLQAYADAQMPLIVPGSTADAVTNRGYRNVWRLPTKDSTEGSLAAQFIAQRAKPKMAVAVSQDGDYGADVVQGFITMAHSSKMTADGYVFPVEKPDFATAAARIMTKSPDFIYLAGDSNALGPIIPALRAAGFKGKFGGSQGFYNQGALAHAEDLEGSIISTSMPPLDRAPDFANQLADFRARYPVTSMSAYGYAAAQIVMAAVRRNGTTNRLATLSALQSLSASYNTIVGSYQFAYNGDPVDPLVYFYTVTNGKFKFIAPSHVTSFVL